jgi:hypothetical protein
MKKLSKVVFFMFTGFILSNQSLVFGQRAINFNNKISPKIIYYKDMITFTGGNPGSLYVWSKNIEYDFSIRNAYVVSFDAYCERENEIGLIFSHNKEDWSSGKSDAISIVSTSSERKDGWSAIRTGMYKDAVEVNSNTIKPGVWHHVEVVFQANNISMYVDNSLIIQSDIYYNRPNSGYIGITQFGGSLGVIKYKNFKIR